MPTTDPRPHATRRPRGSHLLPILLIGMLLVAAAPAEAHAELLRAEPRQNARVDDPPALFVLSFSEELEPRHAQVQVRDADGTDRATGLEIVGEERRRIEVETQELEQGVYTVRWDVLSAVDGHTTSGAYLVAVGMDIPAGTELPESEQVADIRFWETLARAIAFGGASLIAGIPTYLVYRFRFVPIKGWTHVPVTHRVTREAFLMRVGAMGGIVSAAAVIAMIIGLASRIGEDPVSAVATTTNGTVLALRAALLLIAAALAFQSARPGRRRLPWTGASLGFALAALLVTSLSAHAASTDNGITTLNVAMDFLHHAAAAAWISGVMALLFTLPRIEDTRTAGILVRDFSPFAVGAVVLLVATGIYASLIHLDDPFTLGIPGSGWEWALWAKIALVIPLIALGAYNRYRLQPRLLAGVESPTIPRIKRSVRAEVVLMAIVLLATGAITHATPPSGGGDDDAGPLPGQLTEFEAENGDLFRATVQPQPVTVGVQNVTVHMEPADGLPENIRLFLTIHSPGGDETGPLRLERLHDEHRWYVQDTLFTESGGWHLIVNVQGKDYRETFDFVVEVE